MNEPELRALVREAVARHLNVPAARSSPPAAAGPHPSHALFLPQGGMEASGHCVIEPAVACTHCGYCKSYGH